MFAPDFQKCGGLIPVIVQDHQTREVLMLAYMSREAWQMTLETGKATYFSRSRQKLWVKGESSRHFQMVKEIRVDCDDDTILLLVHQQGEAACHKGYRSCFYRIITEGSAEVDAEPIFDPQEVYHK